MKMSSLGGQWRVIRQYLSMINLNAEVEKLVQKIKPATPEQWDNLITKFEKVVAARFSQGVKETEVAKTQPTKKVEESTITTAVEQNSQSAEKEKGDEKMSQGSLSIGSEAKEITIEGFMQGLKLKKDLHFGNISDFSWKSNKPIVTKSSIHSRTAYVISAIVTAETDESLLKRTENFIDHLKQYPEARDYAIKEGGVRALLRVRSKLASGEKTTTVAGIVNEALALLGYSGPTRGPGPSILSIDGGGIRGIIAIEVLRHLERLTGRRVEDMFDYIIGVSTGAIIASVLGSGIGNLETASEMYHTLSRKMFGNTSLIGGASRLVWSQSYYDTDAWEQLLKENLGALTLTECNRKDTPKMALVSCVVNSGSRLSPFLFRSYEPPFRVRSVFPGTIRAQVWQAVRASAAAPTYFNEFRLEGLLHQEYMIQRLVSKMNWTRRDRYDILRDKDIASRDGGIMVNNPTGVGMHEAKLLYGANALRNGCVISVGTGQALNKHLDYQLMSRSPAGREATATSWRDKFNKILDSATDTEGMHLVLNDLLPAGSYYRFNPPLMEECGMDEVRPEKLQSLVTDTHAYIRRNQHKFEMAASMLTRKRSVAQKVLDFVEHQSQVMGVVQTK